MECSRFDVFVVFLSLPNQIREMYTKVDHARLVPYASRYSSRAFLLDATHAVEQWPFFLDTWLLKMGPIGSPEMSVLNQPALRNDPKDGRILLNGVL